MQEKVIVMGNERCEIVVNFIDPKLDLKSVAQINSNDVQITHADDEIDSVFDYVLHDEVHVRILVVPNVVTLGLR